MLWRFRSSPPPLSLFITSGPQCSASDRGAQGCVSKLIMVATRCKLLIWHII
ncbi:hypothetical protein PC116_g33854 [Phytophthora cactorum]|nr:hypothetical protein PC116_g33854 [Phytophthora cactorum]